MAVVSDGIEVFRYPLANGVFTDNLGLIRCLIDNVVGQLSHERFRIVAVDSQYIRAMSGYFDRLRVSWVGLSTPSACTKSEEGDCDNSLDYRSPSSLHDP